MNIDYSEYIMKPLPEVLGSLDSGTLVYLGSKSAFFDIATAGVMMSDGYLEQLTDILKRDTHSKAEAAKKRFNNALSHPPKWQGPNPGESIEKSIEEYITKMRRWPDKLVSKQKRKNTAIANANDFTPLEDRLVKDIYPRIDRTGVCVIVTGHESGGYWSLDEKQSGRVEMLLSEDYEL